jgi:hypothetical protein
LIVNGVPYIIGWHGGAARRLLGMLTVPAIHRPGSPAILPAPSAAVAKFLFVAPVIYKPAAGGVLAWDFADFNSP